MHLVKVWIDTHVFENWKWAIYDPVILLLSIYCRKTHVSGQEDMYKAN